MCVNNRGSIFTDPGFYVGTDGTRYECKRQSDGSVNLEYTENGEVYVVPAACNQTNINDLANYQSTESPTYNSQMARFLNRLSGSISSRNIFGVKPATFFGTITGNSYKTGIVNPPQIEMTTLPPQIEEMQNEMK